MKAKPTQETLPSKLTQEDYILAFIDLIMSTESFKSLTANAQVLFAFCWFKIYKENNTSTLTKKCIWDRTGLHPNDLKPARDLLIGAKMISYRVVFNPQKRVKESRYSICYNFLDYESDRTLAPKVSVLRDRMKADGNFHRKCSTNEAIKALFELLDLRIRITDTNIDRYRDK